MHVNKNNGIKNQKIPRTSKAQKRNFFKKKKIKNSGNLKRAVKRDKACLSCGTKQDLSAHHIIFRSQGGDDSLNNLITLCFECHRKAHDGIYELIENYLGVNKKRYISPKEWIINILEKINRKLYEETLKELKHGLL